VAPARVTVIGAGIVGVVTAHYLRRHGLQVTVLERREDVARETSFANAGVLAPGYVGPWAQPGMPSKLFGSLLDRRSAFRLRPRLDRAQWSWLVRWLAECRLEPFLRNKARLQRLALYSQACLRELRTRHGLAYQRGQGYLQLYRRAADLERAAPTRALFAETGVVHQLLDAAGCRRLEPALDPGAPLAGGLSLPEDETGDCALFATRLRDLCQADGVRFHFHTEVTGLVVSGDRIEAVRSAAGPLATEAVVVAAGCDGAGLLAGVGLRLPLYPVKGYSLTYPVRADGRAPVLSVMDEAHKIAITRLGDRLRVAGIAELGGRALRARPSAFAVLRRVARTWFPGAVDETREAAWVGARPMLPDGPPALGPTRYRNLFLNLGHGASGWALACGSGRIVADLVAGGTPEIDLEGLTLARFSR
jgi:D-amino-acid dehydrogenase